MLSPIAQHISQWRCTVQRDNPEMERDNRDNPEMERCCQTTIFRHDVGGVVNAMHELVHEQDLVVLNPTRELIHASHSTSHPHPHHVQRLKDAVTHCPTHITW